MRRHRNSDRAAGADASQLSMFDDADVVAPDVVEPAVEDPVVENPVVENPVVENPVVEDPVVENPVVEDPVVENPVFENPDIENPVFEELVVGMAVAALSDGARRAAKRIRIVRGDLSQCHVDVIVTAANSSLSGGPGVDGVIHDVGGPAFAAACEEIRAALGGCRVGDAATTTAGNLNARCVVHAVGPRWRGGHHNEDALLASAYRAAVDRVRAVSAKTVAFPSLSSGANAFPLERAARIALTTIANALAAGGDGIETVQFVLAADDAVVFEDTLAKLFSDDGGETSA